jgi:hypothetical protein
MREPREIGVYRCDETRDKGPRHNVAVKGLNWSWITLQLGLPPVLGLLATIPLWRRSEMILGNVIGTAVILTFAIGLIFREYVEVDRAVQACIDAGTTCWPEPSAFARFAVYASIGLAETFLLFTLSLSVERRLNNRGYAPEWRR